MMWGQESHVVERFGRAGIAPERISLCEDTFWFEATDERPDDVVEILRRYYRPTMNAYEATQRIGAEQRLHGELLDVARAHDASTDGGTSLPATYLRIVVSL